MPKKPFNNRLDDLFAGLNADTDPIPGQSPSAYKNWSWSADDKGIILGCGPEVTDVTGIPPEKWIGQSIADFALSPEGKTAVSAALASNRLPTTVDTAIQTGSGAYIPVRYHIYRDDDQDGSGQPAGFHGHTQVLESLIQAASPRVSHETASETNVSTPDAPPTTAELTGISYRDGQMTLSDHPWTPLASESFMEEKVISRHSEKDAPAVLASPVRLQNQVAGVLEIMAFQDGRKWTEEERLLVQDVAAQLGLALENANLYSAVQQELVERTRAEQEITRRNLDLANLNMIGQRLSRLVTRQDVFSEISGLLSQIVDTRYLTIAIYDPERERISFPVVFRDGVRQLLEEVPLQGGLLEYVLNTRTPLLVQGEVRTHLDKLGVDIPEPLPRSILLVPMVTGDRPVGIIRLEDYENSQAYSAVQVELLSTLATQITGSLENANLFQEIRVALETIENRERYQANIAKAVAVLSQSGTRGLAEMLGWLSNASQCNRISYLKLGTTADNILAWKVERSFSPQRGTRNLIPPLQVLPYSLIEAELVKLATVGHAILQKEKFPDALVSLPEFSRTDTFMILPISKEVEKEGILLLEDYDIPREWRDEEISVLRVASDALHNTIVREDLLGRLQGSLEETESLYTTSHKLALAVDIQEMVNSLMTVLDTAVFNRSVLILFENDDQGTPQRMRVEATYYSGNGTPPPRLGTEFIPTLYGSLFQGTDPKFIESISSSQIDEALKTILTRQNVQSLAMLPLWAGKTQVGSLVVFSSDAHHFTPRELRTVPPLVDQMATSIENTRLFERTQAALAETELLYSVTRGVSQARDSSELLRLVGENAFPEGADQLLLMVVSKEQQEHVEEVELVGVFDRTHSYHSLGFKIPAISLPILNQLGDEILIIDDIALSDLDPTTIETFKKMDASTVGIFPLRSASRLVGVLAYTAHSPKTIVSSEDIHTLQIVGNSIAVAMERQHLLAEAQRRALELQTAAEIARDTTSTLSLESLLNRIVNLLKERFGFYHTSIFLLDPTGKYAVIQEATGEAGQEMKRTGHRLAVGSRSVVGAASASGEPMIVNDVTTSPNHFFNPLLPKTRSEVGIPLKVSNRVIGTLDIQSTRPNAFGNAEIAVLQILSDQIAVAIENARSYELSQRAIEEMRELDRVKSQFLANMSHELRTPLNSVIGFSRVILKGIDGPINETQQQDITAIYNSGLHLLNLINDILDLSKIEAGKMELQIEEVNLSDIANAVLSTAAGLVKGKPIQLLQTIPANLAAVRADHTRISQVMLNLVSNAIKFTDKGSITINATASTNPKGQPEVMVTVTDTGLGIAEKDQSKLFQRFSQVDDSPTRKTGGTGLGLSISKSLVEMHGGQLGLLSSEVSKGSVFFFTLPLPIEEAPVSLEQLIHGEKVILSIDDDPMVIGLYKRYLKPAGYKVIPLIDPTRAVETAKELAPFAITLDIMMPERDGWLVMQDLKQDEATRNIPVVICSILEEEEKGFSLGATNYLVKPFVQDDLLQAINRLNQDGVMRNILVIDDDPEDLRLAQKIIEDNDAYRAILAQGGDQGLQILQENVPDIILLDLFMPGTDGFLVLEKLRTDPQLSAIPVIILTGADLKPEQHRMLAEFGKQMLTKSMLKENELLNTIEAALNRLQPS